ncbi:MAG: hypothetical protein Q4D56_06540 [Bacteroides sp.]|nr:hypothetical protein [Bacteroides sp.]
MTKEEKDIKTDTHLRILQVCDAMGLSQREFSRRMGRGTSYVKQLRHITSDVLHEISLAFPEINILWIINGEGEMFNAVSPEGSDMGYIRRLKEEIEELKKRNEALHEQVIRLKLEMEKLKGYKNVDERVDFAADADITK